MKNATAKNPFFLSFLDPENIGTKNAPKIIQFTRHGLQFLLEYYNQKYSNRPQISIVFTSINQDKINSETENIIESTSIQAIEKILAIKTESPKKIILSFTKDADNNALIHSIPLLVSTDKLILLVNERDKIARKICQRIAKKINLEFVEPMPSEKYSFQADRISCHMISGGVLKDLDQLDIELISTLKDGYQIDPDLAKLLKYSQSSQYNSHISNGALTAKVKQDNTNLEDYVLNGKSGEFGSRIQKKQKEFREKACDLDPDQDIKLNAIRLVDMFKKKLTIEK